MYINKNHIAFAEGLKSGFIDDDRGHGYEFIIRNLTSEFYLILSDAEDGSGSPSPDSGDVHSTVDGDPMQWAGHVSLIQRFECGAEEFVKDGIFTGTTSECLQFMSNYELTDGSVKPDGQIRSGYMIVGFDMETMKIVSGVHDGEALETFEDIGDAKSVLEDFKNNYGDDLSQYMLVLYTSEEQRQTISKQVV